jgi:hypothetical protein
MTKLLIAVAVLCVALLVPTAEAFSIGSCSCGTKGVLNVELSNLNKLCYCDTCTGTDLVSTSATANQPFVGPNCTEAADAYVIVRVVTLNDTAVTFFSSQALIDQMLVNAALNETTQCTQPCIVFNARLLRDPAAPKYTEINLRLKVRSYKALDFINFVNARADPTQVQQRAWFEGPLPKELRAPWADSTTIATVTYSGSTVPVDVRAVLWVILCIVLLFLFLIVENCVARCCCAHEDPELNLRPIGHEPYDAVAPVEDEPVEGVPVDEQKKSDPAADKAVAKSEHQGKPASAK